MQRGVFSSRLAFIFAASGSAVGLGNIWGFPTNAAENGGAAFVLMYLILAFLTGLSGDDGGADYWPPYTLEYGQCASVYFLWIRRLRPQAQRWVLPG